MIKKLSASPRLWLAFLVAIFTCVVVFGGKRDNYQEVLLDIRAGALDPDSTVFVPKVGEVSSMSASIIYEEPDDTRFLLDAGASVHPGRRGLDHPLRLAVERGRLSVVAMLLKGGADPNSLVSGNRSILEIAAQSERSRDCIRVLLEHGADPSFGNWAVVYEVHRHKDFESLGLIQSHVETTQPHQLPALNNVLEELKE